MDEQAILRQYPDLAKVVDFHGHLCPGLVIGYKAARAALASLQDRRALDEEMVAIVYNDACGVDALQVLLGCTLGKGNLIFRDYGKQVYIVGSRRSGRAVRLALKPAPVDPEQKALRARMDTGKATAAEEAEFQQSKQRRIEAMLSRSDTELFDIREEKLELPGEAQIFSSVICSSCGETGREPRARLRQGQPLCLECYEEYSRGW